MAAYGLARFRFKGRTTIAYTTLLLRTVPLAVLAIPVFLIWNEWQLVNSLWGLVLLYVAVNLPFTIWLLYGFVLQVPIELEEAAAMDGDDDGRVLDAFGHIDVQQIAIGRAIGIGKVGMQDKVRPRPLPPAGWGAFLCLSADRDGQQNRDQQTEHKRHENPLGSDGCNKRAANRIGRPAYYVPERTFRRRFLPLL
jgi:hypothetical protein